MKSRQWLLSVPVYWRLAKPESDNRHHDGSSDNRGADNGSPDEHATYFEILQLAYNVTKDIDITEE